MAELRTPRLLLRPWRESDLPAFAALNADPEVRRWFLGTLAREESDAQARRIQEHIAAHQFGFWAVEVPGAASFVGFVGLKHVTFAAPFAPAVEAGWRLARDHWGRGYATEAAWAALSHGFGPLGLPEIVAFAVPRNLPSRRVMERIGMRHDPRDDFDHPALPCPRAIRYSATCSTASSGKTRAQPARPCQPSSRLDKNPASCCVLSMSNTIRVALIGDYDPAVMAHQAIPLALALSAERLGLVVEPRWLATDAVPLDAPLGDVDAAWCVPASPYRDTEGALRAIRAAREGGRPFLGTCGGFQHAVLEYARNVLGWADAEHAETAPEAAQPVIAPLSCALVEVSDVVRFVPGSRIAAIYDAAESREGYHCRYGLNPAFARELTAGPLRAAATDAAGEVRAVELDSHPFFVATLFQPERAALAGTVPPLAMALLRAASI